MGQVKHFIHFEHLNGAVKDIPGIANKEDVSPRLIQETEEVPGHGVRTVFKRDPKHVAKILLFDEDVNLDLTEKEKKLPASIQERIISRRSAQADTLIQANEAIRKALKSYENQGSVKVLDWDVAVDSDSPQAKAALSFELSPIALADYADRGIEIPSHMKGESIPAATAEKSGVIVKGSLPKNKADKED